MMSLSNHFLLPTAQMSDPRFFDALILVCRHNQDGAWGFIINEPNPVMSVGGLLAELNIDAGRDAMLIPSMRGGPLRMEAGFVLHTGLPKFDSSFAIGENICLTTSKDILPHLAPISKFAHFLLVMGFCSWQGGQLEKEIKAGDWLTCPAVGDILFHADHSKKLTMAYDSMGVCPTKLAPVIGQA